MACRSLTLTRSIDGLVADLVGLAVVDAPLDAAAGQPGGEGVRVVVAAGAPFLHDRQPAELAVPDHQRRVEQAALLQIGQQAADRLSVSPANWRVVLGDVGVAVPAPLVLHAAAVDLHEPHAALDQPPGDQALLGEVRALGIVEAVQLADRLPARASMSSASGAAICMR